MVTLLALAVILPSAGAPAHSGLPSWVDGLNLREDATRVDKRPNAASNVRMRPADLSLKVLLAEVVDYRIFLAPLGSKIPLAFAAGLPRRGTRIRARPCTSATRRRDRG